MYTAEILLTPYLVETETGSKKRANTRFVDENFQRIEEIARNSLQLEAERVLRVELAAGRLRLYALFSPKKIPRNSSPEEEISLRLQKNYQKELEDKGWRKDTFVAGKKMRVSFVLGSVKVSPLRDSEKETVSGSVSKSFSPKVTKTTMSPKTPVSPKVTKTTSPVSPKATKTTKVTKIADKKILVEIILEPEVIDVTTYPASAEFVKKHYKRVEEIAISSMDFDLKPVLKIFQSGRNIVAYGLASRADTFDPTDSKEEGLVKWLKYNYDDGAADGWMEGDITLHGYPRNAPEEDEEGDVEVGFKLASIKTFPVDNEKEARSLVEKLASKYGAKATSPRRR